jgi:hypothetical protein
MHTYEILKNNPELLNGYKSREKLPMICSHCNKEYFKLKYSINDAIKQGIDKNFCSRSCHKISISTKEQTTCGNCFKNIFVKKSYILKRNIFFCSKHCSAFYYGKIISTKIKIKCTKCSKIFERCESVISKQENNFCSVNCFHKTHFGSRSKLEKWLEEKLTILYPDLKIKYNNRQIISYELDIYIPSLKLAFELNGPTHYKKIYKNRSLEEIQRRDKIKVEECHKKEIELHVIDVSAQKVVNDITSIPFLSFIIEKINLSYIQQKRLLN